MTLRAHKLTALLFLTVALVPAVLWPSVHLALFLTLYAAAVVLTTIDLCAA